MKYSAVTDVDTLTTDNLCKQFTIKVVQ